MQKTNPRSVGGAAFGPSWPSGLLRKLQLRDVLLHVFLDAGHHEAAGAVDSTRNLSPGLIPDSAATARGTAT